MLRVHNEAFVEDCSNRLVFPFVPADSPCFPSGVRMRTPRSPLTSFHMMEATGSGSPSFPIVAARRLLLAASLLINKKRPCRSKAPMSNVSLSMTSAPAQGTNPLKDMSGSDCPKEKSAVSRPKDRSTERSIGNAVCRLKKDTMTAFSSDTAHTDSSAWGGLSRARGRP